MRESKNKRQTSSRADPGSVAAAKVSRRLATCLRRLGTTTVSDALESLGLRGELDGISALTAGRRRFAGRAITIQLEPVGGHRSPAHLGAAAVDAAARGDVIVIANGGRRDSAAWGGLLSSAARAAGVAGVVIDGLCRDVDEVRTVGLSVFALGVTPLTARGRVAERSTGESIRVGARRVHPGDWVVADSSGVVVVPAAAAEEVMAIGERIAAVEAELKAEIADGAPVAQVLGKRYEGMLLR